MLNIDLGNLKFSRPVCSAQIYAQAVQIVLVIANELFGHLPEFIVEIPLLLIP